MRYEVPIIYRGQASFIVEADSPTEAERKAVSRFNDGDQPHELGNEWESIERVAEVTSVTENS